MSAHLEIEDLKLIKCNLRGVLLSRSKGVPIKYLLLEYEKVTNERLRYKKLGFSCVGDLVRSMPDVARIVIGQQGDERIVGMAISDLNITARKNGFKGQGDFRPGTVTAGPKGSVAGDGRSCGERQVEPRGPIGDRRVAGHDVSASYDFRATFKKDACTGFEVIKYDPKEDSTTKTERAQLGGGDEQKQQKRQQQHKQQEQKRKEDSANDAIEVRSQNGSHGWRVPASMQPSFRKRMHDALYPGSPPLSGGELPACVDVVLTHAEQANGYFWGVVIRPFQSAIAEVSALDERSNEFSAFDGGQRAVYRSAGNHFRTWVKSRGATKAVAFMLDFGNVEEIPLSSLLSAPESVWSAPPIARPFHAVAGEEMLVDRKYRCWLAGKKEEGKEEKEDSGVFEVERMVLID